MLVQSVYNPKFSASSLLPLLKFPVTAGFPSPANDYWEATLDLHQLLIQHPSATYFIRVQGNSMTGVGIFSQDLLIVDRSLEAIDGSIVIAIVSGEFTVKRLRKLHGKICLVAENPDYPPLEIDQEMDFQVWGVVTHVIHKLER